MAGDGHRRQGVPGRQRVGQRLVDDGAAAAVRDADVASIRRPAGSAWSARAAAGAGRVRRRRRSTSAASSRTVGCWNRSITPTGRAGRGRAQPGHHLGGQQRVAAEVEEVVVDADPSAARAPSPRPRRRRARSAVAGGAPVAGGSRRRRRGQRARGRACRWRSAAARPARRTRPAPCTRAASPASAGARSRSARRPPPTDVGDQPLVAGPVLADDHRGLARRPGWSRSAASISPSSIRKPRSLTWSSSRPRNSSAPSAAQRARSPVRYSRAAGRRRTGRARTARRSARAGCR